VARADQRSRGSGHVTAHRLLAKITLSLLFAFCAAADMTIQLSLLQLPSFDATPGAELHVIQTTWNLGDEAARGVRPVADPRVARYAA
jgi:hypothetical protein